MKAKTNDIYVTPVKKYAPPKYPTQKEAALAPELLRKLPSRWKKNAAVAAMLGLAALNSCGVFEAKIAGYSPNSENFLNVAPIFIHGEGMGSLGCMMIAPPVFLSEQEALAIIKGTLQEADLSFDSDPPGYTSTSNKRIYDENDETYNWEGYLQKDQWLGNGEVGLDLYDSQTEIAVSYISMEKAQVTLTEKSSVKSMEEVIESNPARGWSSYPRELAQQTAEDFARQNGDIAIGVFYEPGMPWDTDEQNQIIDEYHAKIDKVYETYYKPYIKYDEEGFDDIEDKHRKEYDEEYKKAKAEYESNMKLLIEEDLRAQVRDFIEWLQAQGII